ncbi:MAG: 30S ribosomal protein S13 [Candidatus Yanofskybacteria bacterium]|nr:30S ribosomal protein S13 [Candidatus Yanofskybacteria bacterium]
MAWIAGINIPDEKKIWVALTSIYGIGPSLSIRILKEVNVNSETKAKDLKAQEVSAIKEAIEKNCKVEGELRRDLLMNVRRLREIGSLRGTRHAKNLPVRGQRTRTNSRTVRGNKRKTVGSGRKPASSPT